MGGLGWGGLGGFPVVPPIAAPIAAPVAAVAKRAAVEPTLPAGLIVPQINNGTVCTYAEKKSILSCLGNTFNFECPVIPNNLVDFTPIRVQNLTVVLDERVIDGVHIPIFRLFSRVGHVLNNFSLVNKDKEVVLSVFNNERLAEETGLRVKDTECWTAFVRMYREVVPNTVDFDFVESHISTVPVAPRV